MTSIANSLSAIADANRSRQRQFDELIAGAVADGHGAITGWHGSGSLTLREIRSALITAGLPEDWAPANKRARAHAGYAVRECGYRSRSLGVAPWRREGGSMVRAHRGRWIIIHTRDDASVGSITGTVAATVTLFDGSDELIVESDDTAAGSTIAASIRETYAKLRADEVLKSHDVTTWLRKTLATKCGAIRYAIGMYVPREGRDAASKLVSAIRGLNWGAHWISPLLPVATSSELVAGLARTFEEDAAAAVAEYEDSESWGIRALCSADSRAADLESRISMYSSICGPQAIAPVMATVRALRSAIRERIDGTSQRFALVADEVAGDPVNDTADDRIERYSGSVTRGADEALDARRQSATRLPSDWIPPGLRGWKYDGTRS